MALVKVSAAATPTKADFVYSNPAPGGVTVSDTEFALFVGSLFDGNAGSVEVHGAVEKCLAAIRNSGFQAGGAGVYIVAECVFNAPEYRDHKINVTVSQGLAGLPPTSNAVSIHIGGLFQRTPSASVTTYGRRAFEAWMENHGKKAA